MEEIRNTVVFPIERACREVVQRTEKVMRERLECSRREMWVLMSIDDTQLSQKRIGEMLGLHSNVMVKLLDEMEDHGLTRRVRGARDRREQIIELTGEGKRRLARYIELRPQLIQEIFRPLKSEQIEQWRELARQVLDGGLLVVAKDESDG